jgi:hypothetical protein
VGPTSVIDTRRKYSQTIRVRQGLCLRSKSTKNKTATLRAQLRGFNSCWRWAIHQPRVLRASIPCDQVRKTAKRGKMGPENPRNQPKSSKIDRNCPKDPREIARISGADGIRRSKLGARIPAEDTPHTHQTSDEPLTNQ